MRGLVKIEYLLPPLCLEESELYLEMASEMTVIHHSMQRISKIYNTGGHHDNRYGGYDTERYHIFSQDRHSNEKIFIPWSDHNKPPSSFLKRLRDTQGTPSEEFLETLVDRNLDENVRPKTPCKCPKVTKMSDREVIMAVKQRRMDKVTETQARPPAWNPIPSDWSDDENENDKDDQARAPIAKPILQDPQFSTSFGTYPSETLPKSSNFWMRKYSSPW